MSLWEQLTAHVEQHASLYLVIAMMVLSAVVAATVALFVRLRAVSRPFSRVRGLTEDPSELLQAVLQTAERTESNISRLDKRLNEHLKEAGAFVSRVGLVRYDAFEDIAGMQSFSMCLLNGRGDGVLITYLTGKKSTRSYAVTIERGRASRELSDEERRAVAEARGGDAVPAATAQTG